MRAQEIQGTVGNFIAADLLNAKNIRTSFKSMLAGELQAIETFADSWQVALEKYFGQSSQNYYHVMKMYSLITL